MAGKLALPLAKFLLKGQISEAGALMAGGLLDIAAARTAVR